MLKAYSTAMHCRLNFVPTTDGNIAPQATVKVRGSLATKAVFVKRKKPFSAGSKEDSIFRTPLCFNNSIAAASSSAGTPSPEEFRRNSTGDGPAKGAGDAGTGGRAAAEKAPPTAGGDKDRAASGGEGEAPSSPWARVVAWFKRPRITKDQLVKMGTSALLAYGFVSNVNAVCMITISWKIFTVKTGLSPLTAGQWPQYLLAYVALYATVGTVLRPIRVMVAAGITPVFDKVVSYLQEKLKANRVVAIGTTVFLVNFCGTLSLLAIALGGTSLATGMPILPSAAA